MKVMVIGGSGMLGHKLTQRLGARFETWATVRGSVTGPLAEVLEAERTAPGISADDIGAVAAAVDAVGPDVIVNAVGIIKQADAAASPVPSIQVNSLFPHQLGEIAAAANARLIHISTDCVFSGKRGNYSETDLPDATDLYGRSKLLGEINDTGCLTLRTSIVGRELSGALGLFEWFISENGGAIRGFPRAVFSGFTTIALAEIIAEVIESQPLLMGLWHVSSEPIDKLTLLTGLRDRMGLDIEIMSDDTVEIDRSLDSTRFREKTGIAPPSWPEMLDTFVSDPTPYDKIRSINADR